MYEDSQLLVRAATYPHMETGVVGCQDLLFVYIRLDVVLVKRYSGMACATFLANMFADTPGFRN